MKAFKTNKLLHSLLVWLLLAIFLTAGIPSSVAAQDTSIIWSQPANLSNTPEQTSTDPFILADPAGIVHVWWAEKVSDIPGGQPDTILYSQFDGRTWSQPVDLFFAPASDGNMVISYPHAVLDDKGIIHLIWLGQPNFPYYTLFYSSAPASQARFVQAWKPKVALAENLSGTKYSVHIAYSSGTLSVVYAHGAQGQDAHEDRGISYIQSQDGGKIWSEPIIIFTAPNLKWGVSDTRLATDDKGGIFTSWTLWGEDGNGRAVYFSRSLDGGLTWDAPLILSQARDTEYERDWNNLVFLPDNQLMAIWEGGYRAYRHAMYSTDRGATWTEPWDIFPRLIGENGYAEFVTDSRGKVHLFYSQRIREGFASPGEDSVSSLWHSVYLGDSSWSDPLRQGGVNQMLNPKVALVNGNTVVVVWYTTANNDYEIRTMTGVILGAPETPSVPWPESSPLSRGTVAPEVPTPAASVIAKATPYLPIDYNNSGQAQPVAASNPAMGVVIGVLPVLVLLPLFLIVNALRKKD